MFMSKLTSQVIANGDYPIAETKYGKLCGVRKEGSYIFRGIKYADARRFHMPYEVQPWEGVKEALNYGPVSPEFITPIPNDQQLCPHYYMPQDEHCQYLNIWTQTLDKTEKRPVMLWLHGDANHGGSWFSGSGVEQYAYDGEALSKFGDVVVVSLNHRLNCLGYLDLSFFNKEYEYSAMAGLGDLIAALKWIRDNIASFGGDPANVTLFGQSGGGDKILTLMQMPDADGLFHKVAIDSCNFERPVTVEGWMEKKIAQRLGQLTVETLGLTAETITDIERIHYWHLVDAIVMAQGQLKEETGLIYKWGPLADGQSLLGYTSPAELRGETVHLPMLLGSVFGEGVSNGLPTSSHLIKIGDGRKNIWGGDTKLRHIQKSFGDNTEKIIKEFQKAYPEHNLADVLFMDDKRRLDIIELAAKRAEMGGKAWIWVFTLESPINGGITAWHCAEIPFIFHNADCIEAAFIPGVSERLQDIMAGVWVAFAKTGDPNCTGLPEWPMVESGNVPTMLFDKRPCVRINHDKHLLELMKH